MKTDKTHARRWLILALAGTFLLGAMIAVTLHRGASAVETSLPPLPDFAGKPEELKQKLTELQGQARIDHGAPDTVAALGRFYHANGFLAEAAECWQMLHAVQPTQAYWAYYLADLSRTTSDEAGLQRWLEKTVELAPDYAPAWLQLGDMAFKRRQFDAAENAYRRRLECVPRDPYASFGLARILLELGKRAESKRKIEELIRTSPDFSSAHNFYAELLHQENDEQGAASQRWLGTEAGRFRAADDPWLEELRSSCYDVDQLIVWGQTDLQTKHGDHGRSLLERAVRCAPNYPRALEKLGEFYLEEGEADKAREVLERGLRLPKSSETLYVDLFNAYLALKRPTEALRVADRGLTELPQSARLHSGRGQVLAGMGRLEEAEAAFHAAMSCAPGSPEPVTSLGLALLHASRREEGIAQLKRALEIQPQYSKAIVALSQVEMEAGHRDEAAQYIVPFFNQFPGSRLARELMSRLYLSEALDATRRGDFGAVEKICRDGLSHVSESAELHGFLGSYYARENRLDEALQEFEASRQLRPDDPRVLLSLGVLYHQLARDADARRLFTQGAELARRSGNGEALERFQQALQQLSP